MAKKRCKRREPAWNKLVEVGKINNYFDHIQIHVQRWKRFDYRKMATTTMNGFDGKHLDGRIRWCTEGLNVRGRDHFQKWDNVAGGTI